MPHVRPQRRMFLLVFWGGVLTQVEPLDLKFKNILNLKFSDCNAKSTDVVCMVSIGGNFPF